MDEQASIEPSLALQYAIVLAPVVEGVVLFFLLQSINPFWSSLFGVGGHLVERLAPPHSLGWIDIFGLLVWPVLLLAALHRLGGWMLRLPDRSRRIVLGAYCLSLLIVVPLYAVEPGGWGFDRLPLYFTLWSV